MGHGRGSGIELPESLRVSGVPRIAHRLHDLHVVLRHRPPSISPLPYSPQPHGFEGFCFVAKGRVPDHAAVPELHGLPEVDLDADSTACTGSARGGVDQHQVIEIAHLHDGRPPVGKRGQQARRPLPQALMATEGPSISVASNSTSGSK